MKAPNGLSCPPQLILSFDTRLRHVERLPLSQKQAELPLLSPQDFLASELVSKLALKKYSLTIQIHFSKPRASVIQRSRDVLLWLSQRLRILVRSQTSMFSSEGKNHGDNWLIIHEDYLLLQLLPRVHGFRAQRIEYNPKLVS